MLAKTMGFIPYDDKVNPERFPRVMKFVFTIQIININFVLLIEFMYIVMSVVHGENFEEATMSLSYFGFTFVSYMKTLSVMQRKSLLTILISNLRQIYPSDLKSQKDFNTRDYVFKYNLIGTGFVFLNQILIWWYNFYPAVRYLIYEYWLAIEIVPRGVPYYMWVPWDWQYHWSYYFIYASLALAGHTAMSGQLTNDLLLCAIATQITMHYRYLAQRIEAYQPCAIYSKDRSFLNECIQYHQNILRLSDYMNDVFGVSLLVNFISSSFVMCFLGFQMTIGVQTDALFMLFMFLLCSLVQIFMICSYGEELIAKGESVGYAAYKQNWISTDVRYRKMLTLIIKRSQKPALLKATKFLKVSMETMADLLKVSYKFYALIRTMYSK